MAPEQVREQPVDARTDVFAAGVVLWEALSGRRLFVGGTASQVISSLLSRPIEPLSEQRSEVGPELDQLLQSALARAPAQRFASARDFADALEATGKLASRAEVAAWVQKTARAALEQRSRLCSELGAGTVRMQLPPVRASFGSRVPLPLASRATTTRARAARGSSYRTRNLRRLPLVRPSRATSPPERDHEPDRKRAHTRCP